MMPDRPTLMKALHWVASVVEDAQAVAKERCVEALKTNDPDQIEKALAEMASANLGGMLIANYLEASRS